MCRIFLSCDIFFSVNLVLNQLEMGVVSILGLVPQKCEVFIHEFKQKKF